MKLKVLSLMILVCSLNIVVLAQSDTARLVGTITDVSGAVIDNAAVSVTNTGTGRVVMVQSNSSGAYVVNALPAGNYHIEVKKPDFKTATADFSLDVSQVQEISFKLEPGSVATTVDVTAGVPLVDTSTSSTGEVIHGRQVTELPLNGRNFTQLALLTPGVTRGAYGDNASGGGGQGTASETFRNSETGGAALSANGLRPQANNFILDGVDNNDGLVNTIVFFPPAEGIQEFRVNTSVAPAEYGRGGGAIVQTTLKSGTNQLHGTAFFFRRSGEFDARPYDPTGKAPAPVFRQSQFGGTLGGAIWKNRLFAFGDYQGRRQDQPLNVEFASVPTAKMRTGDFSELLGLSTPTIPSATLCPNLYSAGTPLPQYAGKGYIYNPTTCQPFGWNGTVGTNIISNPNPVGLNYLQTFPMPTLTTANFQGNYRAQRQSLRNFDDFDIRVDFSASQKDQLFVRYSYGQDNFTVTNRLGPCCPSGFGSGDNIAHPRGLAVGYSRIFTPTLLNEFRFGYIKTVYGYNPPNINEKLAANIGIPGANPTPLLGGQALIGGNNGEIEYQGDGGPYNVPQKFIQFTDSLSYTRGRHIFKFGATVGQRRLDFVQGNSAKGYFVIGGTGYPGTGRFTGYEMSELLAGFVDYQIGEFNGLYKTRSWETGYFAQDDWRVTNRLTLNLGLRYDLYTWPYEASNRQSNWLPNNPTDPGNGALITAGTAAAAGLPRSLIHGDYNDWAPRVGFALDLLGDGKTVLRGGYGLFYFLDRGGVGNQLSNNPNFNGVSTYLACPSGDCSGATHTAYRVTLSGQGTPSAPVPPGPYSPPDNNWLNATGALPPSINTVNASDPKNVSVIYYPTDSRNSHVQQWNVQVERQLGANMAGNVAYVGTKMNHLATAFNANQAPFGGRQSRWYNLGGNVNEYAYIGNGNYNGLQANVTRRLSSGLMFTASYAWSHTTDDSNGAFSTTGGGGRIFVDANGNPLISLNRGNSDQDIRHNFVLASMYELPSGKGKQFGSDIPKALDYVIGGWQWNNIITLQTGTPIDLSVPGILSQTNRPDVSGPISAKIVHGPVCGSVSTCGVIAGLFAAPPASGGNYARAGTLGRNYLYGPGYHTWDMGMMKDFALTQSYKIEFRADVFNLFNHPQFQNGSFNTTVGSGTGTTASASTRFSSERQMQFAFRFMF